MQDKYALRCHDRALTPEASWQFLAAAPVGRLGLAATDGSPYIVPLNHVVCGHEIFFHCAGKGRKLELLRANPQVCYEVDSQLGTKTGPRACDFGTYYKSVIAFGQAYEVDDNEKKAEILNRLVQKHAPSGHSFEPATAVDAASVAIIGIRVETLTGKSRPYIT